ncbi:MAG: O-antigen ligase family protein, partial [Candidatus Eisenbacteria bacterium]
ATGGAGLAALALARLFACAKSQGWGATMRDLTGRASRAMREDLAGSALLCLLASSLLSTFFSINPLLSLHGASGRPAGLVTALAIATFFFASRRLSSEPRWLDRVSLVTTLAAAAASAYAIAQFLGLDPIGWSGAATFHGRTRVSGTLGHPNTLGAYLAMTLPLTLLLASRTRSPAGRASVLAAAALSIFVMAATLSRGAWLGAAAAVLAFAGVWLLGGRQRETGAPAPAGRWRIGAIVLVSLLAFLLPLATPMGRGFVTRIREVADLNAPTTQSRVRLWRAGLDMMADRPLLGAGTDAFGVLFPRYRTAEFSRLEWNASTDKAHNEVIQIAATQGLVGIAAGLLVFFFVARATLRVSRRQGTDDRLGAAVAAASLAAWGVSSATGFSVAATGSLAAVVAGWAAGRARSGGGEIPVGLDSSDSPGRPTLVAWVVAALLVTGLWVTLVLPTWSAALQGGRALGLADSDTQRVEGLKRAAAIAPWEARWSAELGRTYLIQSFAATNHSEAWHRLGGSRGAYEQAVRVAPENPEYRAYLARVLAEQASTPGRTSRVSPQEAESALAATMAADPH